MLNASCRPTTPDAVTPQSLHPCDLTISSTMSVNEILQRYPQTERVFVQLCIDRRQEGYESVDELAWRHGVDVLPLIEQLREAV
jgi:hypothetical protein